MRQTLFFSSVGTRRLLVLSRARSWFRFVIQGRNGNTQTENAFNQYGCGFAFIQLFLELQRPFACKYNQDENEKEKYKRMRDGIRNRGNDKENENEESRAPLLAICLDLYIGTEPR